MSVAETLDTASRHEAMRIAGRMVDNDRRLDVMNPYTGGVVGTVAMASVEQVREAFRIAADYKPTLSRHDRQCILFRAAEILERRREAVVVPAEGLLLEREGPQRRRDAVRRGVLRFDRLWRSLGARRVELPQELRHISLAPRLRDLRRRQVLIVDGAHVGARLD